MKLTICIGCAAFTIVTVSKRGAALQTVRQNESARSLDVQLREKIQDPLSSRRFDFIGKWRARRDSNARPSASEADTLSN